MSPNLDLWILRLKYTDLKNKKNWNVVINRRDKSLSSGKQCVEREKLMVWYKVFEQVREEIQTTVATIAIP